MESTDSIPHQLGDFEIIRELGRGGMGVVYEARQKSLNRRVALKVLSSGLGLTTKAIMRFKREAEAAARLHHTNIVPIYATGEEGRVPYYVMELVEGPSLDRVIRLLRAGAKENINKTEGSTETTEGLPGDEAFSSSDGECPDWLAKTVGFAKPDDAQETDGGPTVGGDSSSSFSAGASYFDAAARMMADVADALEHAHDQGVIHRDIKPSNLLLTPDGRLSVNDFGLARMLEQPGMTISGEFVGSPLYMSPEQITAGRVPLDHRTDIYSLGATLYELLTLRPPFPAKQRDQVLSQIIHKEPEPLRKLNDKVPRDLETICLKSLDKDPDRRYQTAGQMAADLRRYVNRHAISARRIGPVEKTIRYLRRNPYAAAFLGLLLVTVSVALIAGWQAYEGRRHQELRLIENDLFQAVLRGDYSGADELLRNGERLRPPSPWVEFARGQISLFRGEYEAAKTSFGRVLDEEPNNTAAKSLRSVAYMWGGDEMSYLEQIAEINEVSNEFDDLLFLGYAKIWAHPEEALKLLNKADQIDRNHPLVRVFRASAGRTRAMELVDPTEAKRLIDKAIEDCESSKGLLEETPQVFSEYTLANLAAANIYKKLAKSASSDTQFHLDRVARFLDAAKSTRVELERFRDNSDAQVTLVLLLQQTLDDDAIRELAAQWDREGVKVHTYAAQCLGLELFRMREYEKALRWLNHATGRQERNTRYLNFYVKLANPRGESRGKLLQQASAYLADKINENERSFLSSDAMLLVLLGDEQAIQYYNQNALRALFRAGEVFRPLNEYFCPVSERLIKTPEQLIAKCSNTTAPVLARMNAHFDLGVEALSRRDFDAAAVYFEKCWQDDGFNSYVYGLSRAILEHKEDWPTWVPADTVTDVNK